MQYYNLAENDTEKLWQNFIVLRQDWINAPNDKAKFLASRKAFQEYSKKKPPFQKQVIKE